MDYKIVGEYRPRICSCQFFVKFEKHSKDYKVLIDQNKLVITSDCFKSVLNMEGKLSNESVTGYSLTKDGIQFRTKTDPIRIFGSFQTEILVQEPRKTLVEPFQPPLLSGVPTNINCKTCSHPLLEQKLIFKRILPLPISSDLDFFCHGSLPINLDPKTEDCLFGLYFIKISAHYFLSVPFGVMNCNACGAWLGIKEKRYAMLWNSSVELASNQDGSSINSHFEPLNDFINTIKYLSNCVGVNCKGTLYCQMNNDETIYLLIWIIDKSLTLLVSEEAVYGKEEEIHLKEGKAMKLLFTKESGNTTAVKDWDKISNVSNTPISLQMMLAGMEYLKKMSQNIPEEFRKTNNMNLSYLML